MKGELTHSILEPCQCSVKIGLNLWNHAVRIHNPGVWRGNNSSREVDDQGRRARDEIAEVVGQVRVEPTDQRLLREIGVEPEDHLAQDEVAERVVAVLLLERE